MRFKARHLGTLLLVAIALAALGGMVMLLWNAVMPSVFTGARAIDHLQALGLLALSRILFGGFRGGGWRRGWHGHAGWRERWRAMTDEEREQFRRGMAGRWRAGWQGGPEGRDDHRGEGRSA
ncbi:MAG TPA: hypothetical protein VNU71_03195 [Burkholderiaceae bacterium]|nr:hypothetical protein [Burkholderiaceae bacterium]